MAVIGFSYKTLNCERKKSATRGSIEIKHNITIQNVEKTSLAVGSSKNDVLKVEFSFDVLYGSGLGKISMVGDVLYTDTTEIVDETLKSWEADKKLATLVGAQVHKFIFNKSIIKAIELSDSLGLPSPVPLPKIQVNEKK